MAIEVELPDGSVVEFPDGTDTATMERALAQHAQATVQAPWQPRQRSVEELRQGQGFDPTEGNSFLQNAVLGFGRSFVNTGEGIAQLGASIADKVSPREQTMSGLVSGRDPSRAAEWEQRIAQRREIDAPLMDTAGGVVGNIAGQATQIATPIPGGAALGVGGRLAPYLASAGRAATFGGMQGTVGDESRGVNAATEGAFGVAGQGVADLGGMLAKRAASRLARPVRESIELARGAGIPLRADQVTQSGPLRAAAAVTKWLPFSGAGRAAQKQQEAFNAAVGRSFGVKDATVLTDEVMKSARKARSAEFEDIYSRNNVTMTEFPLRRMAEIEREATENLVEADAKVVRNQLDKVLRELPEDGVLTGKKYQALRTALQGAEDGGKIGKYVKQIRATLDETAALSVGPEDAARLAKNRGQWANMRTTEEALKQVSGAAGNVRPASLWPLIRKGSTKEMRQLAKVGQNVLKDVVNDSGTAQRSMYQSLLSGSGTAGAAGTAYGLGMLAPFAKVAAVGMGAGRVLNSNMASKLLEQGKPTKGLARLLQSSPRLLPAAGPAGLAALGIDISGGRRATQEDIERDAEIVRRYRQQQGR